MSGSMKATFFGRRYTYTTVFRAVMARRSAAASTCYSAIAIPSACLSVTRRYCVKTTARSTVLFALSDSKMCLVL